MTVVQKAWNKKERDEAMNLRELGIVSGYNRNLLAAMKLPLIEGKIFFSDFRRVMRKRQDSLEMVNATLFVFKCEKCGCGTQHKLTLPPGSTEQPVSSSPPEDATRRQAIADKFDAPSSRRANKSASRLLQESPLRATG